MFNFVLFICEFVWHFICLRLSVCLCLIELFWSVELLNCSTISVCYFVTYHFVFQWLRKYKSVHNFFSITVYSFQRQTKPLFSVTVKIRECIDCTLNMIICIFIKRLQSFLKGFCHVFFYFFRLINFNL